MKNKIYLILLLSVISGIFSGCYTVPETGRHSLNISSEGDMATLSAQSFEEMKKTEKINTDPVTNARIQALGKRIIAAVGNDVPYANWEFVVFENDEINAFAMSGGKVGVYTGLIKFVDNEDQLSFVIGHEIAHVVARHSNERYSQQIIAQLGSMGLGVAMSGYSEATQQIAMQAYGVGAQYGALLPFSRSQESEADTIGIRYMARAGYDPREAPKVWEKMAARSSGSVPELLSTHPSDESRIKNLKSLVNENMPVYEAAKKKMAETK